MNQFQIHDSNGKAIAINDLDAEACTLWGTQIDKKSYASPYDKPEIKNIYFQDVQGQRMLNEFTFWSQRQDWFNSMAWKIAQGNTTWKGLREAHLAIYVQHEIAIEELQIDARVWGFIELIEMWESKGYIPVSMDGDYNILSKNGIHTATAEETTVV